MSFAANLKKERRRRELTQQQAADLIGIKKSSLNAYEQGYAEPNIQTIKLIVTAYEIKNLRKFLWE